MFQAYSVIFTTFDILKPIFPHLGIFRMIQAQLDLFMYIKAYSEPMAYSGIFRTADIFSQFQTRAIHAYSEPYLSRFRHIYNSGSFRVVLLHAYSGIFIKLHILRHIFPHWDSYIFRILASQVLLLNHCSDLFGTFFYFCLKSKYSTSFSPG